MKLGIEASVSGKRTGQPGATFRLRWVAGGLVGCVVATGPGQPSITSGWLGLMALPFPPGERQQLCQIQNSMARGWALLNKYGVFSTPSLSHQAKLLAGNPGLPSGGGCSKDEDIYAKNYDF